MYYDPNKVIEIALNEIGYLEKATNENLDDKTANAGDKNYTKYARDLWAVKFFNGSKVGAAWCAVFVGWCFYKAFGKAVALKLLCQPSSNNCGAGCGSARNYFKNKNQLITEIPQSGDVIYFYSSDKTEVSHTGIVYSVDNTYVYTIEGNTSSESGVVANGGAVAKKRYKLNYERIAGYGRPDWGTPDESSVKEEQENTSAKNENVSNTETTEDATKATEKVTELANGLGSRTLENGSKGDDVKTLQELLNEFGFAIPKLDVDGKYGYVTAKAVRVFQRAKGILVDGKYGKASHAAMVAAVATKNAGESESASSNTNANNVSSSATTFAVGDEVKLVSGATYTSGKSIPSWVFDSVLYVRKLYSDKATVSTLKSGAVTGVVALKYLKKIQQDSVLYQVKVTANALNIRAGAGKNYKSVGVIRDYGVYTIVEEKEGQGASKWLHLQSGAGWISADFCEKI